MNTRKIAAIYEFYKRLVQNRKNIYVGKPENCGYLSYCLNSIRFSAIVDRVEQIKADELYVFEDRNHAEQYIINTEQYICLEELALILNWQEIPGFPWDKIDDKKIVYWGLGRDFEYLTKEVFPLMQPDMLIDSNKEESNFNGLPLVSLDMISPDECYLIISTRRYRDQILSILVHKGWKEHENFLDFDECIRTRNSKMFMDTINDRPLLNCGCTKPFDYVNIGEGGEITHCCYQFLPYIVGNIRDQNACDSITSKIIRISFMNQTYSFCNTMLCPKMKAKRDRLFLADKEESSFMTAVPGQKIKFADMAFDHVCNLYCASCRCERYVEQTDEAMQIAEAVREKIVPGLTQLTVAGNGEVFLSKAYRHLIMDRKYPDLRLAVLSNGNLIDENQFAHIDGNYKEIRMFFSVDAATESTYVKARRGGNWARLRQNMEFVSRLRKENKIVDFRLRFVVSRLNYLEMPDFVKWCLELGADMADFSRLENWGTYSEQEFSQLSMFDGDVMKEELLQVLEHPIMRHPIVHFYNF